MKTELNLDPIKVRLDAVEALFGRNWKIADDEGSDCHVLTEDSGDPFTVGEEFVPICVTSQENPELWEFLRTGLDVQRNLIAEIERLRTKDRDGLKWEANLAEKLLHAQGVLREAAAEIAGLWKALADANNEIGRLQGLHSPKGAEK